MRECIQILGGIRRSTLSADGDSESDGTGARPRPIYRSRRRGGRSSSGALEPGLAGMPPGSTDNGSDSVPSELPVLVASNDVGGSGSMTVLATGGTSFSPGCTIPPNALCSPPDGGGQVAGVSA